MKQHLLPIGQDDGHDTIKTCYGYDKESGKYLYGYHKSRAVEGLQQILSVGSKQGVAYETEGRSYTVADGQALIRALDTRSSDYPYSDLNRILVNHALADCGLNTAPLYLITGLPVDQYYKGAKPNMELIDKKKGSLAKHVRRHGAGPAMATILKQNVVSEAIAAFYDALIEHDGQLDTVIEQLIARRPVAVIDLGGKTLDIAVVVENVAGVYNDRSGTENIGVLALITKVAARIKSKFNLNNDPPASYIEEAFRTKRYELFGVLEDVSDIIDLSCQEYLGDVRNFFLNKVGDGSDLGAVIFVGGGTALIQSALGNEAFASVYKGTRIVAKDPEYANARGMWKFASYVISAEERVIDDGGHAVLAQGDATPAELAA
jgi:plasmid segregation protein ParM